MAEAADDRMYTRVRSVTSGEPGRSLNQARGHHFVIDASGPDAEEITPGESFLAGVSGCGVLLVERVARERDIPLRRAEAWIEGVRRRQDPSWYQQVDLRFRLSGVTEAQATELVGAYKRA
jgi:uncharacterized OsmC-like protein